MIVAWLQTMGVGLMAAAGALFLLRLLKSPSPQERILALEGAVLTVVGYLLLQGDRQGGRDYLDAALTLALLSFVATIALARMAEKLHDD